MAKCATCGQPLPANPEMNMVNSIVKKTTGSGGMGDKLKSLRPSSRIRPDAERKSGITRGGRFAAD